MVPQVDARNNYKRQQSPAKLATNSVDWEASPKVRATVCCVTVCCLLSSSLWLWVVVVMVAVVTQVDTHNDYSRESNVKIPVNSVNWKASPKVCARTTPLARGSVHV